MITQEELKELFNYKDGCFYWKNTGKGRKKSKSAGYNSVRGYNRLGIHGISYMTHRLIFLYHHGYLPKYIDHIDNNPSNNRIENLRECTVSQNGCNSRNASNNTSGVKGVYWHKIHKKWLARIQVNGKRMIVGYFNAIEDAKASIDAARIKHHKEFARHV